MNNTTELSLGSTLHSNTYRIERVLGQGGFGITYLAVHVRLKKRVAIKEFFPKTLCNRDTDTSWVRCATDANSQIVDKLKNKFLKEAEHIAEMDSPYIVKITDVFEENGTAYYIMDYIEGKSLSEMVKSGGPLPETKAIGYITKIGEALTYIHSKRINHLDVKPANIMVRAKDDTPVLIDFGLSKQYDSEGNQTSTTPVGISHGFAPMEQYRDGGVREFSPQTDLYSLAATLYYLLSGVVPPQAPTLVDDELTFPASIPSNLIPTISKAMSPSRKKRHDTISQFISKIKSAISSKSEDTDYKIPKLEPKPEPKPRPKTTPVNPHRFSEKISAKPKSPSHRISPLVWLLVGVVAVIVLIVILLSDNGSYSGDEYFDTTNVAEEYAEEYYDYMDSVAVVDTVVATPVTAVEVSVSNPDGYIQKHGYVDLGLPSRLKWATTNVSASSPEAYGSYYAWGETSPKSEYTEGNSRTYGKSKSQLQSEGIINSQGNLTPSYDAARANWGGTWRMPTKAEFDELLNKCKWTWTTQGGKNGCKVTGSNGKSIFLPAVGFRSGSSLYIAGKGGYYWSSSVYDDTRYAYNLAFDSSDRNTDWNHRSYGFSVRPVSE